MKNARQQKILELIEKYEIDTQQTLLQKLAEAGIDTTQTTLSRDIRQLKLVKGTTGRGTYKYVLPAVPKETAAPVLGSAITESVLKIQAAGNLVVIRTLAGMANAVAVCIDSTEYPEIVGSVAGDDTVLIVVTDDGAAVGLMEKIREHFRT